MPWGILGTVDSATATTTAAEDEEATTSMTATSPATSPATDTATRPRRFWETNGFAATAYIFGAIVMVIGFVGSFASFKLAAVRVHIDTPLFGDDGGPDLSHLIPLSVDALALVASVVSVTPQITNKVAQYALWVVIGSVGVSAAANAYEHYMHAKDQGAEVWLPAVLIGLVFPVSMAITMHLLLLLATARKEVAVAEAKAAEAKAAEAEAADQAPATTSVPPPPPTPAAPAPRAPAARTATPPRRAPSPAPANRGGGGEAAVLDAITDGEKNGTPFADLSSKDLAEAAAVSGAFARRVLSAERTRRMTAFLDQHIADGGQLAEITEMQLTKLFGPTRGNPNDEVARKFLDEYRGNLAARTNHTTHSEGR